MSCVVDHKKKSLLTLLPVWKKFSEITKKSKSPDAEIQEC
jgi:hypothetical protein